MFKAQKPQGCEDVDSPMLIYELKCNPNKKISLGFGKLKTNCEICIEMEKQKTTKTDFPGGPGVKTLPSNAEGVGLIPGQGTKIPHAKKKKSHKKTQKQCCHKSNKDFKNGPHQKLWCWKRLLRVPWTARRSNQNILKEISLEYSLEGLMLKPKLQYSGHLMRRTDSLEKTLMLGKSTERNLHGGRIQEEEREEA